MMRLLFALLFLLMATPAWATHIGTEDFTTYTEVDSGTYIAKTASTITATAMPYGCVCYVYYDSGGVNGDSKYYTAARARLSTSSTVASASAAAVMVFGLSNEVGQGRGAWTGPALTLEWSLTTTTVALRLFEDGGSNDTSITLTAEATYYVEVRWIGGEVFTAFIYSDSAYSTLVDTISITDATATATYRYIYGLGSVATAGPTQTSTVTVAGLTIYRFQLTNPVYMNRVIPADFDDDFEDYPTGWSETEEGSGTVSQSTDWAVSGSNSAKCTGDGANRAFGYQTVTGNTVDSISVSAVVRVASISDGSQATFFGFDDTDVANYRAYAAAYRSGSTYSWRIVWHNNTAWATVNANVADTLALNTAYTVELRFYHSASLASKEALSLTVNGTTIVEIDSAGAFDTVTFERVFICDTLETSGVDNTSVRYLDDLVWQADEFPLNNGLVRLDSGVFCGASRWAVSHGWQTDAGGIKMVRSTDGGSIWALADTIDETNPDDDRATGGLITDGSTVYVFNAYRDDNETSIWATSVWTSTDQCQNFSKVASSDNVGWHVFPSLIENGVILGAGFEVDADNSDNVTKLFAYTIATNAWTVVSTMATAGDYADAFPNEAGCYRHTASGKLTCIIRWDDYTGAAQLFETVQDSDDDGATWNADTDLSALWLARGGTVTNFEFMAGFLWVQGYLRMGGANANQRTFLMQVDPSTYTVFNEVGWAYTGQTNEAGNGQIVDGGFDANGDYHIYYLADAVTAVFYDIILPITQRSAGTPRGGPMILRNYVGGNYALDH